MSNDANTPAERDQRAAVRQKAQQVKASQARARVLRTSSVVVLLAAVIAAVAVVVTWTVSTTLAKPVYDPANVTNDGIVVDQSSATAITSVASGTISAQNSGIAASEASDGATDDTTDAAPTPTSTSTPTPVDIRVYVDYLSEGAGRFQVSNAKQLSDWVAQGSVTLTYHPVAILTAKSNGTKYSLRAAAASACVATHAPDTFFAFNYEILSKQPKIDTDGWTDAKLADIAIAAGAENPKVVRSCIEDQDFLGWAKSATERALNEPLPGTAEPLSSSPTILVNGEPYLGSLDNAEEFAHTVFTASSDAYYKSTPTPTPSASPSASETPAP